MKQLTKSAYCALWKYTGAMAVQETLAHWSGAASMSVLLFHRVTDEIPHDGLTVSTQWFRSFCRTFSRRFHVVSLAEIVRLLRSGEHPPKRTVAITFDDCYRDNLFAARMLADHGLPACFFVPSQFVGTDHLFDWDRELKRMPNLSWDDVREMIRLGHEIGSHSVSHADFGVIDAATARRELADSKKTLEDQTGQRCRWFAYPYGGKQNFRAEYLPLVYDTGYDACFSGFGGFIHPRMPEPIIARQAVPCFNNILELETFLSGGLDWIHSLKRQAGIFCCP